MKIEKGQIIYCIKDYYEYFLPDYKEKNVCIKYYFKPFEKFLDKIDNKIDDDVYSKIHNRFFTSILFFFLIFFVLSYFLLRRWIAEKRLRCKCNQKYVVNDFRYDDDNYIEIEAIKDEDLNRLVEFVKKRRFKFKFLEDWTSPKFDKHFVDFKSYRKKKLEKIRKN